MIVAVPTPWPDLSKCVTRQSWTFDYLYDSTGRRLRWVCSGRDKRQQPHYIAMHTAASGIGFIVKTEDWICKKLYWTLDCTTFTEIVTVSHEGFVAGLLGTRPVLLQDKELFVGTVKVDLPYPIKGSVGVLQEPNANLVIADFQSHHAYELKDMGLRFSWISAIVMETAS
jgi:hypothetical protein